MPGRYTKQTWDNLAVGNTPINETRLDYMEEGIEALTQFVVWSSANTLTIDDTYNQKTILYDRTDTGTLTIPTGFVSGGSFNVVTINTGSVDIVGQGGVTFIAKRGQSLIGEGSEAYCEHRGSNIWKVVGDVSDGYGEEVILRMELGNPGTGAVTITATGEVMQFLMPVGVRLYEGFDGIQLESVVASSSGIFRVDVEMPPGTSIFSTRPSMDAGEDTSETAAAPVVTATRDIPWRSRVSIDIDDFGTGVVAPAIVFAGRKLLT